MNPLSRSSGDPLANRRADYAEMLFGNGEHAAAAEIMMGAMELAPDWALGWFRLGEFHEAAGIAVEAAQAWRICLKLDPADRAGAGLKLALIGAAPVPDAPPSEFVAALFDQYAPNFEASLVTKLGYGVPDFLLGKLGERHFALALDLGCGTGLMGERLRPITNELVGYDISAEMLKKAAAKKIYDRLEQVDIQALAEETLRPDLVTAADVFIYTGALDRVFAAIARMLTVEGLFAFSVELHDGDGFVLRDSRRYAHSESYLRDQLSAAGFRILSLDHGTIRQDRGQPIPGLMVVAIR